VIVFENSPAPAVRAAELELAGRRIAVRGVGSVGETGSPAFRFDPVGRRFVARRQAGVVASGPSDPEAWAAAFSKAPPGPALVEGSAGEAEDVRGAFRAAAEGARRSGRGVYLLDAPAAALPSMPRSRLLPHTPPPPPPSSRGTSGPPGAAVAPPFVLLVAWSPDADALRNRLAAAAVFVAAGIPAGLVWPVYSGWTDAVVDLEAARRAGASFAVPILPAGDVEARRAAVDARQLYDPEGAEAFFDAMFHGPWEDGMEASLAEARRSVAAAGLSARPPRPASGQPAANTRAAARLEDLAVEAEDEHRAARLLAASRWIDACGRDLGAIWREGNLARAFPLGAELAADVDEALREALT